MRFSPEKTIAKIDARIGNTILANAIYSSVDTALNSPIIYTNSENSVWSVFQNSLDAAIRNIEEHPRGKLFQRLIEYGPHNPDVPEALYSDGESTLSDPECGQCVQFIFSHMVNRFKGELAELLSIEPCLRLIQQLQNDNILAKGVLLYLGDKVQERRRKRINIRGKGILWGSFAKGADGLIVEHITSKQTNQNNELKIHGIIEVKSMSLPKKKVFDQIQRHLTRLSGGVKLEGIIWEPNSIIFSNMLRIMVVPSTWKLSREWHSVKTDRGRKIVLTGPSQPTMQETVEYLQPNYWKIELPWSEESLNQAAYEMTFWYMSQVGKLVYGRKSLPNEWGHMTAEEAGFNAIKMMLYYLPLRYISERQTRLAIKLYNIYSFGYPLGVDSKEMLWPEDFLENR